MVEDRSKDEPQIHWRQLQATTDRRELFRYERRGETLVYWLRLMEDRAYEVSVTDRVGANGATTGAMRFTHADTYISFLHDVEKNLVRDGWTAGVSPAE